MTFSVVQDKAKQSQFGAALVRALLVGMVGTLMAAAGPARAVQIDETEIESDYRPERRVDDGPGPPHSQR